MLLDKLEQANRESRRVRQRITLVGAMAALVAGLFLFDIVTVDFARLGLLPGGEETPARTAPAATPAPTAKMPAQPAAPPQGAPNPAENSELRDAFKAALAQFDEQILPSVNTPGFAAWNADIQKGLLAGRDTAVAQFSEAGYPAALGTLDKTREEATQAIAAQAAAFNKELASASAFFDADDHEAAKWRIDAALRLRPDSQDALDLKARIDRLPEVLKFLEDARTARIENNLEAEAAHLRALLQADPTRSDQKTRLNTVEAEIKERAFADHVRHGLEQVDKGKLQAAEKSMKAAKALFADRQETAYLATRVAHLARDHKVQGLIAEAREAAKDDDWKRVEALYDEAAKLLPDKQEITEGRRLAKTIIDTSSAITDHLATPERLSSLNVAKLAEGLLADAKNLVPFSPSLHAGAKALTKTLADYAAPVSIRVVSDGETNVSVRSVGKIGKTQQKFINLRPGKYTFEGARPGYRSKLVDVTIPPGKLLTVVEVICDEPL